MKQGEIILIKFPFSNHTEFKVRPALVISNRSFNSDDIMILGVSSQKGNEKFSVVLENKDLMEGETLKKSFVRCNAVLTIEKNLAIKIVAVVSNEKLKEVLYKFSCFVSFEK